MATAGLGPAIAVVGMACRYPDANSPLELWENVLARRRAFRRLPPQRLNLDDYRPRPSVETGSDDGDSIYIHHAAVLEGWEFDRVRFRVSGASYRSADLSHWLALEVATAALEDAGFPAGRGLPREATGVLLGNTLTGEFSRANLMRLRWPFVRRMVGAALAREGWDAGRSAAFLDELEHDYKAPFPPMGEESLAGGLSNTIAGRICNHYDLRGGGYTLDGACSSSLLAVANACSALAARDLEVAVCGGVDLSLDPFELVGFSRTAALSPTRMRVYDRRGDGFWPGEGCGMLVLMRHQDAIAMGCRCYALLRGWGISSDGSGGLTRPEVEGQRLAMGRAYQRAGWSIDGVPLFEGHGTGTAVGDEVELRALDLARQQARPGAGSKAAIGSIKANIGHTKAASGAAGLIKTVMALHTQVLPPATGPTTGSEQIQPHPRLLRPDTTLRLLDQGEPWPADQALRAGVSSFGFGGIDVHLALEGAAAVRREGLTAHDLRLIHSSQEMELFFLRGEDRQALLRQVRRLAERAQGMSQGELTDLAAHLAGSPTTPADGSPRAAILAAEPEQLSERLGHLAEWLDQGIEHAHDPALGVFLAHPGRPPRIGLLFSGQASPVRLHGGAMARRFPALADLYRSAALPSEDDGSTASAQPAIITAQRALLWLLQRLGIEAELGLGHSLGEYTALHWAGAYDGATLQRLVGLRGRLMATAPGPAGGMAAIQADGDQVAALLAAELADGVVVSCYNSPRQTVVSGALSVLDGVLEQARTSGLPATRLPVATAFHSPLMAGPARTLGEELDGVHWRPLQRRVVSTVDARELPADADLSALLQTQMTSTVRFTEALARFESAVDLALEVGPGQVLSGLAEEGSGLSVYPLDGAGPSLAPFLMGVAAAYVEGAPVSRRALFDDRLSRPFDPEREPGFLANPCELAPVGEGAPVAAAAPLEPVEAPVPSPRPMVNRVDADAPAEEEPAVTAATASHGAGEVLELLRGLVAKKIELPVDTIEDHSRLSVDLHINSIAVGQLVAEAARSLGLPAPAAPLDYADATLAGVAEALEEQIATGPSEVEQEEPFPAGIEQWVRPFEVVWRQAPLPRRVPPGPTTGQWALYTPTGARPPAGLGQCVAELPAEGTLLWLPAGPPEAHLDLLQRAVAKALETGRGYWVLVQQGAAAAPLARTLQLEHADLTVVVLDLPDDAELVPRIQAEVAAAMGYQECRYDAGGVSAGVRLQPLLRPLPPVRGRRPLPLGSDDVLLVSGGGKGIAAECALALAREAGVRLALLGRSDPEQDTGLAENLRRFAAHGVEFRYYPTDINDPQQVRRALEQCSRDLGEVTAVLHGAGINRPRLLHELSVADFQATLGPKADGFDHLLAALRPEALKVVIGFGSIIARSGMRGEADYAIANQALALRIEQFQRDHPQCLSLCLEWSIWSGVGMGERLGRVDALLREGITPISPQQGVDWLLRLLVRPSSPVRVVVSGRLGALPTLQLEGQDLPLRRFLDPVRIHYPGIELIVEPVLRTATDPYLADHALQGTPLFPAVRGLEAMAQAAMAVLATDSLPTFRQVELLRPITVAEDEAQVLRIIALVRDPHSVEVVIRTAGDGFSLDHFRAHCLFDHRSEPAPDLSIPALERLDLDPERDLYEPLLFHRGRFRRITAYHYLCARCCCAEVAADDGSPWFGAYLPTQLVLGDPGSRDAALHGIQACIPHARLLPVGVDQVRFEHADSPGPWTLRARETAREGNTFTYDMELRGRDGALRESWRGLRLVEMEPLRPRVWTPALLRPLLERRVEELLALDITVGVEQAADDGRTVSGDQAIQNSLEASQPILHRADGRPETADGHGVSASQAEGISLAVTAPPSRGAVGCDLEPVAVRSPRVWRDLLGGDYWNLALAIAERLEEDPDRAATRVWGARECLKKVGAMNGTPLVLLSTDPAGWVVLSAGDWRIASGMVALRGRQGEMGVAILGAQAHASL